jgi:CPA2 family monovalent cation:H+ antiporter-2
VYLDPSLPAIVAIIAVILACGLALQMMRQPQVVGYLIAGIILGPHVLGLITDVELAGRLGAIGVVLLLFFVGMEVAPRQLAAGWRIAVVGTVIQVLLSVGAVWLVGIWLDWSLARIVLLGFVISLSSTAVIIKLLQDNGEMHTRQGQDMLGVLLVQDLIVIPMLIVIGIIGGNEPSVAELSLQLAAGFGIIVLLVWAISREAIHLPMKRWLKQDHELEVFAALLICFGLAVVTGLSHLSTALGAFAAGVLVTAARETEWVHHSLNPFRVIFVATFFVSVGILVDMDFIREHAVQVALIVLLVLLTNTFLNAFILRALGYSWRMSLYAGAMLAQIGEFSFVLAAVGRETAIITDFVYQLTIAVIALSLLISPVWIAWWRRLLKVSTRSAMRDT